MNVRRLSANRNEPARAQETNATPGREEPLDPIERRLEIDSHLGGVQTAFVERVEDPPRER